MKRYNIFNQIHKALRALLYDTSLRLQTADFSDRDQREEVMKQVQLVLDIFEGHAHTEDNFILPKIAAYEPSVSDAFEKEHVEDMRLGQRLAHLITSVNEANSDHTRVITARLLNVAFVDFMVFNLQHMKKEEEVLNELLWRYFSDEELVVLTREIVASIPAEKMAITSKWMIRGLADDEIVKWLKEVKENAPAFIFQSLTSLAISETSESRWQRISLQLEDKLVA